MSCLTSNDNPAFGLANQGRVCSGHGICLNVTLETEVAPSYLCACDSGWNGVTDMFDLRIAVVNGTILTLDCPNSVIVHSLVWGVAFATFVFRQIIIAAAVWMLAYEGRYTKRKKFRQIFTDGHLMAIILFDMVVSNPLLIITTARKLFYQDVFGTDILVTVSSVFGVWLANIGY
jgi:hypothetical protein